METGGEGGPVDGHGQGSWHRREGVRGWGYEQHSQEPRALSYRDGAFPGMMADVMPAAQHSTLPWGIFTLCL